jgi:hypothetical protein
MMLTKPKPDTGREKSISPVPVMNGFEGEKTSPDDREQDLERRLALLGVGNDTTTSDELTKEETEPEVEVEKEEEEEEKKKEDNLMSFDPIADPTPAPPAVEPKPEPVAAAPALVKPNKSALLARIMAAQERAKQAQMKAASSTTTSTMKQQSTTSTAVLPAPTQIIVNAEQEKEKMMKALNGIVDDAIKKE